MGRSSWKQEGRVKNGDLSQYNSDEGTAARTRPYSYNEIMLRRKNKKLSENAETAEGATEGGITTGDIVTENASNAYKSERDSRHDKASTSGPGKYFLDEAGKPSSRMKEDKATTRLNTLSMQKERESHAPEKRLKSEIMKAATEKYESKREEQFHRRKRNDQPTDNFRDLDARKHSRDLLEKDRHVRKVQGKSEKEGMKKHHNGDDNRSRERNGIKNLDIGSGHGAETAERKDRTKSCHEGFRHKRRRSRSREQEENQHKRSDSLSLQAHKHTSYNAHEHEATSHNHKGGSEKHHSDVDRKKIKSNGSSSHHRRHSASTSGLGGYSPRKRKIEAAARTPSPTHRSPTKRTVKWDIAPAGANKVALASISSNIETSTQTASSNAHGIASAVSSISATMKSFAVALPGPFSLKENVSVDSVQLTEATRPMRRLYIENLPASASEKAIKEHLNDLLLSSGVNHIPGSKPCISCTIHKEKGQALVEFLTPEDTKTALSFDGSTFSGSTLKMRRPKDFIEVVTGELEKSEVASTAISDTVEDSPYKIFIGGISTALSSEMLMEIASAFGPLKSYHFEINKSLNEPCAFLEYADHSATGKACAGLNGMKLGGQIITAVQAMPDTLFLDNTGEQAFGGIPELARPLLEKPTEILKLKNLFDPESFSSLSEVEVEDVLEDVRLECARFGNVKSINVAKGTDVVAAAGGTCEVNDGIKFNGVTHNLMSGEKMFMKDTAEEDTDEKHGGARSTEVLPVSEEAKEHDKIEAGDSNNVDKSFSYLTHQVVQAEANGVAEDVPDQEEEPCQPGQCNSGKEAVQAHTVSDMAVVDLACDGVTVCVPKENLSLLNTSKDESDRNDDRAADKVQALVGKSLATEDLKIVENDVKFPEAVSGLADSGKRKESEVEKDDNNEKGSRLQQIFEPGCVFVEYSRTEAACIAAHCLHGRLFDHRVVTIEYVDPDLYRTEFLERSG